MSRIKTYFNLIDEELKETYNIANKAKKNNIDITNFVEIPIAKEISQRVEGLISVYIPQVLNSGIAKRIQELEKEYKKLDWRIALTIAFEVSQEKFCKFKNQKEAIETGIRIGFSYITLGVISAPLEGFIDIDIKKTKDYKDYICLNFAGPIRAAGATAGAICVLIGDYLRQKMNFEKYDPTENEIDRFYIELMDYNEHSARLQYLPTKKEVDFLIQNVGVEISGDPTEEIEISLNKDLERVKTNRIRGGMCLVVAECLIQKANKLNKRIQNWGKDFGLKDWFFLEDFLKLQKEIKSQSSYNLKEENGTIKKNNIKILPNYTFVKDVVGGRPVFTMPMQKGGFRLRYGRNRTSGFASTSISSQTFHILNDFLAVGTQLRLERPGKATVITSSDELEPPVVKLKTGEVKKIKTNQDAKKYADEIEEIIHLGDILISYGEFSENNHRLVPNGYVEEQWAIELVDRINNFKN